MNEPTDQQIIETLAKREGWRWTEHPINGPYFGYWEIGVIGSQGYNRTDWVNGQYSDLARDLPKYTESLDALQPILMKLTEEEWRNLFMYCTEELTDAQLWEEWEVGKHLLTKQPRQLALCICKVIGGGE